MLKTLIAKRLMLASAAGLMMAMPAQAQLESALNAAKASTTASAASQRRVEEADDAADTAAREFRAVLQQKDNIALFVAQQDIYLQSQKSEIESLQRQLGTVESIKQGMAPMMLRMTAQLEDAIAVISALGRCDVVGDSAGGHLALNLALAVAGAVETLSLISPNTDRTGRSTTRGPNSARDAMNDDAADRRLSDLALGGLPEKDPAVSPLLADLSDLPPCFVTVATGEVLLDDATLLAVALGRAGVDVTLQVERGLFHLWPLWPHATQQAGRTLDAIARFISAPPVGHVPASMEQSVPDSRSSPEKHTQE